MRRKLGSRHSGRSTSRIGRRHRRGRCWLFGRSGTCGGELRIGRAETGEAAAAAGDQDLVAGGGAFHPVPEVIAEGMRSNGDFAFITVPWRSGASGARTRDLVHAMHALSQLSYGPREGVIRRKVYRRHLAILGLAQAQLERAEARYELERDYIGQARLMVIGGDQIDLTERVLAAHI